MLEWLRLTLPIPKLIITLAKRGNVVYKVSIWCQCDTIENKNNTKVRDIRIKDLEILDGALTGPGHLFYPLFQLYLHTRTYC